MIVNSIGNRDDTRRTTRVDPIQGRQLRLSLDLGLQRAAQNALARAVAAASGNGADAGAYVALDPRNGEVLALGSYPSFDANLFAKPIDQRTYDGLNSEDNGAPLFNRAIAAGYPTGSTFKPITAFAALDDGIITPSTVLERQRACSSTATASSRTRATRSYGAAGAAARAPGLLGRLLLPARRGRQRPRRRSSRSGRASSASASRPGSTCRASSAAWCPTASGATASSTSTSAAARRSTSATRRQAALFACGGIDRPLDRRRQHQPRRRPGRPPGDAAAARGRLRRDRERRHASSRRTSAMQVEDADGRLLQEIRKPARAQVEIDPDALQAIRDGLRAAAGESGGTSADVFARLPEPGLRQDRHRRARARPGPVVVRRATSPTRSSRSSSSSTVESGGFGAEAAAPAARLILSQWFGVKDDEFHAGRAPPDELRHCRPLATFATPLSTATPIQPASEPRPRSRRASGGCGSTRCCCSRRSGWSSAR